MVDDRYVSFCVLHLHFNLAIKNQFSTIERLLQLNLKQYENLIYCTNNIEQDKKKSSINLNILSSNVPFPIVVMHHKRIEKDNLPEKIILKYPNRHMKDFVLNSYLLFCCCKNSKGCSYKYDSLVHISMLEFVQRV